MQEIKNGIDRTHLKYDSNEEIDADGYFDMPYTALEESGELVKLPFLPSDGEKIPMYTYGGGTDYSFQDFGARIMNIVKKYYAENNTYMNVCALTFPTTRIKREIKRRVFLLAILSKCITKGI